MSWTGEIWIYPSVHYSNIVWMSLRHEFIGRSINWSFIIIWQACVCVLFGMEIANAMESKGSWFPLACIPFKQSIRERVLGLSTWMISTYISTNYSRHIFKILNPAHVEIPPKIYFFYYFHLSYLLHSPYLISMPPVHRIVLKKANEGVGEHSCYYRIISC